MVAAPVTLRSDSVPVTLKLSKRFYGTFGQEVTNELVDTLNAVDISYRAEFRELFGAHFGQLRTEMDKLAVELRAEMKQIESRFESRFIQQDGRIAAFQEKLSGDLKSMKPELIGWMVGLSFVSVALGILTRAWTR